MSQQVNLYELHLRPRHEFICGRNVGIGLLLLGIVLTGLNVWSNTEASKKVRMAEASKQQLEEAQKRRAELQKQIDERLVSPLLASKLALGRSLLRSRQEVLSYLRATELDTKTQFSSVFAGFARQTPTGLWLTGFSVFNRAAGKNDIEIRGRMMTADKLPPYIERLHQEEAFHGRRFSTLEMSEVDTTSKKNTGKADDGDLANELPRYVEFTLRSENIDPPKAGGAR